MLDHVANICDCKLSLESGLMFYNHVPLYGDWLRHDAQQKLLAAQQLCSSDTQAMTVQFLVDLLLEGAKSLQSMRLLYVSCPDTAFVFPCPLTALVL